MLRKKSPLLKGIVLVLVTFFVSICFHGSCTSPSSCCFLAKTLLALFAQRTPWKIGAGGRGHKGGGLDRGN
jgi:hypothetical protein